MVVLAIKMRRDALLPSIFASFIPLCGPLSTDVEFKTAMIAPTGFLPCSMALGLRCFLGRIDEGKKIMYPPGAARRDFSPVNVS
jgi:hypothetical protein